MWQFWKRKGRRKSGETEGPWRFDLVDSLRQAAAGAGLQDEELLLAFPTGCEEGEAMPPRGVVFVGNGDKIAHWRVDSLSSLFRGERRPPPDAEMERYPFDYLPFFHGIEFSVSGYCAVTGLEPVDSEFLDIYTQMRRRPDGRSLGPLHDVIWQSAALALGLRPWSEAEYTSVFGQLARSARHFKMGPASRNYIAYLADAMDEPGEDVVDDFGIMEDPDD